MYPPVRKKITKVLTEGAKGKLNDYVDQKRKSYKDALIKRYKKMPQLSLGSATGTGTWTSANQPYAADAGTVFTSYRGCKTSTSVLRPHHSITGSGLKSDAKSDVPTALADLQKPANKTLFADTFVSGHVMNAAFGGLGSNPGNQTILTSGANSVHKGGWEGPVKKAQYFMTLVVKYLHAFKLNGTQAGILAGIESSWRIELSGVVAAQSWWDVMSATDRGTLTPVQEDIVKAITTKVNFTATAQDTPTEEQLEKLTLDPGGTEFRLVVQYLESFKQIMAQVATFQLEQVPNGFGKASVSSS